MTMCRIFSCTGAAWLNDVGTSSDSGVVMVTPSRRSSINVFPAFPSSPSVADSSTPAAANRFFEVHGNVAPGEQLRIDQARLDKARAGLPSGIKTRLFDLAKAVFKGDEPVEEVEPEHTSMTDPADLLRLKRGKQVADCTHLWFQRSAADPAVIDGFSMHDKNFKKLLDISLEPVEQPSPPRTIPTSSPFLQTRLIQDLRARTSSSPELPAMPLVLSPAARLKQHLRQADQASQPRTPIQLAILDDQAGELRKLLETATGLPFEEHNLFETWHKALAQSHPDLACAVIALAPPQWIEQLHHTRMDDTHQSHLHQALKFDQPALTAFLKEFFHVPEGDLDEVINGAVDYADDSGAIQCEGIAMLWMQEILAFARKLQAGLQSPAAPGSHTALQLNLDKFDLDKFRSGNLSAAIDPRTGGKFAHMESLAEDVHILPVGRWDEMSRTQFHRLDQKEWGDGPELRTKVLALATYGEDAHIMAAACMIEKRANGEKVWTQFFHDPNNPHLHHVKSWSGESPDQTSWSLAPVLHNEEILTHYGLQYEDEMLPMMAFSCSEKTLDAVWKNEKIDTLPTPPVRHTMLPEGDDRFERGPLRFMLTSSLLDEWKDMEADLLKHVEGFDALDLEERFQARTLDRPLLFDLKGEQLASYLHTMAKLPVNDAIKFAIINGLDDTSCCVLQGADVAETRQILAFVNGLAIDAQDKLDFITNDDKPETKHVLSSGLIPGKAALVLEFIDGLSDLPVEDKIDAVDDSRLVHALHTDLEFGSQEEVVSKVKALLGMRSIPLADRIRWISAESDGNGDMESPVLGAELAWHKFEDGTYHAYRDTLASAAGWPEVDALLAQLDLRCVPGNREKSSSGSDYSGSSPEALLSRDVTQHMSTLDFSRPARESA